MEIRDPIHGSVVVLDHERAIIDHPLFQRLRNVKQLGFSELSFPSASHTRYGHSIGAMSLADRALDTLQPGLGIDVPAAERFRRCLRLACLLHDVGHAPLSHCTEMAMPPVEELGLKCLDPAPGGWQATHEDYTIKIICESSLTGVLENAGVNPIHIAALIDASGPVPDEYFVAGGVDFRPLLSQLVSSELDMDRVDYLLRDSYFAGVAYGRFDQSWLLSHLRHHVSDGKAMLALDRRALYAFDDFLLSRYHMFLMVYYHHRSIIYEEMLRRYFEEEGGYAVPTEIEAYATCDDHELATRIRTSSNPWARRITERRAYKLLVERHGERIDEGFDETALTLGEAGIHVIRTDSFGILSKYTRSDGNGRAPDLFVIDGSAICPEPPRTIEETTYLFARYGERRRIARMYVAPEDLEKAQELLFSACTIC